MKKIKSQLFGTCALTKTHGAFVKSHIIPASLTRLNNNGEKIIEAEIGKNIKTKPATWYDNQLVTRVGEDILEEIDTPAIEILRKHKLIWSSWGSETTLISDDLTASTDTVSVRSTQIDRAEELQLFFLSLLWRSAASKRPEFDAIKISAEIVEDLRLRVLNKEPGQYKDYPIQLFQLVSKGITHNRTPLLEKKEFEISDNNIVEIEYVRFYFDGLVAHIHLPSSKPFEEPYISTCLRSDDNTIIFVHAFEKSRAYDDIIEMTEIVSVHRWTPPSGLNVISESIVTGYSKLAPTSTTSNIFTKSIENKKPY